jgi:hypothetical protein
MHEIDINRSELEVAAVDFADERDNDDYPFMNLKEVIITYKHGTETVTEKFEINTNTELILRFETE